MQRTSVKWATFPSWCELRRYRDMVSSPYSDLQRFPIRTGVTQDKKLFQCQEIWSWVLQIARILCPACPPWKTTKFFVQERYQSQILKKDVTSEVRGFIFLRRRKFGAPMINFLGTEKFLVLSYASENGRLRIGRAYHITFGESLQEIQRRNHMSRSSSIKR